MMGTVYLVGAGPGAPDLLTVRAVRLLGEADVVFHDALVNDEILVLASKAEKILVGKRSGRHSTAQRFINKRLADAARRYPVVVRLKGGDPMLFGRAHEEISYLKQRHIPVEIVPGVTAALAASADLGVSLTRRGTARSVTFVTPRVAEGERASSWVAAVLAADTAAIYMGAGEAPAIAAALIAAGKPASTPVVVIENASSPDVHIAQGVLRDLPQLAAETQDGPALILVGEIYAKAIAQTVRGHLAAGRL
jgi:uroporphyrin-III C-methyltransferase